MPRAAFLCTHLALACLAVAPACNDDPPRTPPTVDDDPSLDAVELSGTRVHVRTAGNPAGRVLIVLHGGPGDDYRYMLPLAGRAGGVSLADDHHLVFWDQRGVGQSRRHDADEISVEAYRRDLDDLIAHYSPDAPVDLLGHSWGGTYATMFLDHSPDRVRAAALLEPGSLSTSLRVDDGVEEHRALLDQIVGPYLGDGVGVSSRDHARADQALVDALLELNPDSDFPYSRMGSLVLRELEFGQLQEPFDFTTHLDRVDTEVLFVAGADSDTLGIAHQERQRAFFPRSRLAVIPDADHNALTLRRVDAVIPILVDYFAE